MLQEMIRNLISNAVRYTHHGRILIGCRRHGDKVHIEICDSGIGIPEEHIPRLFDEYYQVHDGAQHEGLGLGLAIVRQLGKSLGHPINVRSTCGRGSIFTIEVPRARDSVDPTDRVEIRTTDVDIHLAGPVLVVEDDSFVRSGLESLLSSEGLAVVSAATGEEALALVTSKGIRPHLILSDLNLSGPMNGVDCVEALRAALASKTPAIVLTGDIRSRALDAISKHDIDIALKPLKGDDLLQLINRAHGAAGFRRSEIRSTPCGSRPLSGKRSLIPWCRRRR
jgi:two-component system CheB/CheR fusion protein